MRQERAEILYQFRKNRGLLGIRSKVPVRDEYMLSLLYTPGVAEPCRRIAEDPPLSRRYTIRGNAVALLGTGDHPVISPYGVQGLLPFLESQAVFCKELAGVDAYPLALLGSRETTLLEAATALQPSVSALGLSYVRGGEESSPVEETRRRVRIPVIDLDGEVPAALILVALFNLARRQRRKPGEIHLLAVGRHAVLGSLEALWPATPFGELRRLPQGPACQTLPPASAVVIGFPPEDPFPFSSFSSSTLFFDLCPREDPSFGEGLPEGHYFNLWNPSGEDFNGALLFPGLFRGVLECGLPSLPLPFYVEAAQAVAQLQPDTEIRQGRLFPSLLDLRLAPTVARRIAELAKVHWPERSFPSPKQVYEGTFELLYMGGRTPLSPPHLSKTKRRKSSRTLARESLELHEQYGGVIEVVSKLPVRDRFIARVLSFPQIRIPAEEIRRQPLHVFEYTSKSNLVAVVTDGSAVLGLGDIGPEAGLPVMEGKALLLKTLAGVEAFPLALASRDPEEIIRVVASLTPLLGGVNLEDISAPRCFLIEERLRQETDIPIFHDDQHGTAIVVLAGILNAARLHRLPLEELSVVINGAGAAAIAVAKLLYRAGITQLVLCDTRGALYPGRREGMNPVKEEVALITNPERKRGDLSRVIRGSKVFVGLSKAGVLDREMVRSMQKDPFIFALANPTPEILPSEAEQAGAAVVATGRSDYRNQINNALAFPGIFRGALDVRARNINDEMKIAAAYAIANLIDKDHLRADYIVPNALDSRVAPQVAAAVAKAALETGQARVLVDPAVIRDNTREFLYGGRLNPVAGDPL